MVNVFNQHQCSIVAIEEVPENQTHKYGIISGELIDNSSNIYKVNDMVEKPDTNNAPTNLAIIGRYILTPDIFNIIRELKPDKSGEIQITDALKVQAEQGKVIAYKFKGKRFDCGSVEGFVSATNYFAKKFKINY
jgi:UTP--glucose-1-phosphate uridylyltransferase